MIVVVTVGDVLDAAADVLISTANPWLNMSGGVNGAIRGRAPEIQAELREYLDRVVKPVVPCGTVVRTSAGSLAFSHIIHAVAIDPFYDSSHKIVVQSLTAAFTLAESLDAKTISLPTLATGYGPMSVEAFARAFVESQLDRFSFEEITIVVRTTDNAFTVQSVLAAAGLVDRIY